MFELDRRACWEAVSRSHVPYGHGCGHPLLLLPRDFEGPAS
jgi:hypothetical protein